MSPFYGMMIRQFSDCRIFQRINLICLHMTVVFDQSTVIE